MVIVIVISICGMHVRPVPPRQVLNSEYLENLLKLF